jgi:hypothetical protein
MSQTPWCGMEPFVTAYSGERPADPKALEAVMCFEEPFLELRHSFSDLSPRRQPPHPFEPNASSPIFLLEGFQQ